MDDLISRAAACDVIGKMIHEYRENGEDDLADGMILARRYGIKRIPAADAVLIKHARWKDNGNGTVSCSHCATWFPKEREPYLLYCGYCCAKMDDEEKERSEVNE